MLKSFLVFNNSSGLNVPRRLDALGRQKWRGNHGPSSVVYRCLPRAFWPVWLTRRRVFVAAQLPLPLYWITLIRAPAVSLSRRDVRLLADESQMRAPFLYKARCFHEATRAYRPRVKALQTVKPSAGAKSIRITSSETRNVAWRIASSHQRSQSVARFFVCESSGTRADEQTIRQSISVYAKLIESIGWQKES